jgi:hypothetical protein
MSVEQLLSPAFLHLQCWIEGWTILLWYVCMILYFELELVVTIVSVWLLVWLTHLQMSSATGKVPAPGQVIYSASKHTLNGCFGSLHSEV